MATIAVLAATKDGGWEGHVRTLTINAKVRLVPNDDRTSDKSPDFRVVVGQADVGAAWRQSVGPGGRRISVKFADPAFPAGLAMTLFEDDDGNRANLVWQSLRQS